MLSELTMALQREERARSVAQVRTTVTCSCAPWPHVCCVCVSSHSGGHALRSQACAPHSTCHDSMCMASLVHARVQAEANSLRGHLQTLERELRNAQVGGRRPGLWGSMPASYGVLATWETKPMDHHCQATQPLGRDALSSHLSHHCHCFSRLLTQIALSSISDEKTRTQEAYEAAEAALRSAQRRARHFKAESKV